MSKAVLFNFSLSPELKDWLEEMAWKNRMSMAAYLKMLIENDRKEKEAHE